MPELVGLGADGAASLDVEDEGFFVFYGGEAGDEFLTFAAVPGFEGGLFEFDDVDRFGSGFFVSGGGFGDGFFLGLFGGFFLDGSEDELSGLDVDGGGFFGVLEDGAVVLALELGVVVGAVCLGHGGVHEDDVWDGASGKCFLEGCGDVAAVVVIIDDDRSEAALDFF